MNPGSVTGSRAAGDGEAGGEDGDGDSSPGPLAGLDTVGDVESFKEGVRSAPCGLVFRPQPPSKTMAARHTSQGFWAARFMPVIVV